MLYARDLPTLLDDVGTELDNIFDFKIERRSCLILDMSKEDDRETFKEICLSAGTPEEEMEPYLSGKTRGTCVNYTKHPGDNGLDYFIVLSEVAEDAPTILGEEITHGEHQLHHDVGNEEYYESFHRPTYEFIGFLGMEYIREIYNEQATIDITVPVLRGADFNEWEFDHYMGYHFAISLIESDRVPYKELFHSGSQQEVWGIVNDIIRPSIRIVLSEEADKDAVMERVRKKIDSMGLKADVKPYRVKRPF